MANLLLFDFVRLYGRRAVRRTIKQRKGTSRQISDPIQIIKTEQRSQTLHINRYRKSEVRSLQAPGPVALCNALIFLHSSPQPPNIYTESKYYSLVEYLSYDKNESLLKSAS